MISDKQLTINSDYQRVTIIDQRLTVMDYRLTIIIDYRQLATIINDH